jgi:hypothetical protein
MLPAQLELSRTLDPSFDPTVLADSDGQPCLTPAHFNPRINIKRIFGQYMTSANGNTRGRGSGSVGMKGMLHQCRLRLEGRHHSGIDDSRNILRITQHLISKGWTPRENDIAGRGGS